MNIDISVLLIAFVAALLFIPAMQLVLKLAEVTGCFGVGTLVFELLYRSRGRYCAWTSVSRKLENGEGVLIIDTAGFWRHWWHPSREAVEQALFRKDILNGAYATRIPRAYRSTETLLIAFPKAIVEELDLDESIC